MLPFMRIRRESSAPGWDIAKQLGARGARPAVAATQAPMERDMIDQVEWLLQRARARGYTDLADLYRRAPAVFTQLAAGWRQTHPLTEAA
jgi:hypothetical protein